VVANLRQGESQILELKPTPFKKRVALLNHVLPGVLLLFSGIDGLEGEAVRHLYSPWLNIVVGAAILLVAGIELRSQKEHLHGAIDWMSFAAGAVLVTEGINIHHPGRFIQPGSLYVFAGVLTVVLGFVRGPAGRQKILLSERGISCRLKFRRFTASWKEITSISQSGRSMVIAMADGRVERLRLSQCANRDEIINRCSAAFHQHDTDQVTAS
jgi:hypothetical protein